VRNRILFVLSLVSLQWSGFAFAEDYSVLREGRLTGQKHAQQQQLLEQRKRQQELVEQQNMFNQLLNQRAASPPPAADKPYVNPRDNAQNNPNWQQEQINNAFSFDAKKNQWDYTKPAPAASDEQQNYQTGRTSQQDQNQPLSGNNESPNIFGSGSSSGSGEATTNTQQNFYY
jgi:hypothetical protein